MNALLVEDHSILQSLLAHQLSKLGVESFFASNGVEAIRSFSQEVDIIFMDIAMPVMDGFEATERIRELEKEREWTKTPIIALTAFEEREECFKVGMDDFVLKPVLIEDLRAILWRHLNYGEAVANKA